MSEIDLNIHTTIDSVGILSEDDRSHSSVLDKFTVSQKSNINYFITDYFDFKSHDFESIEINLDSRKIITYTIAGEEFLLDVEYDNYLIHHPSWSLSGSGHSLIEAELNLLKEASEIFDFYYESPISSLSSEALKLRHFLFTVLGRYV
jgi:hypothetical protein